MEDKYSAGILPNWQPERFSLSCGLPAVITHVLFFVADLSGAKEDAEDWIEHCSFQAACEDHRG